MTAPSVDPETGRTYNRSSGSRRTKRLIPRPHGPTLSNPGRQRRQGNGRTGRVQESGFCGDCFNFCLCSESWCSSDGRSRRRGRGQPYWMLALAMSLVLFAVPNLVRMASSTLRHDGINRDIPGREHNTFLERFRWDIFNGNNDSWRDRNTGGPGNVYHEPLLTSAGRGSVTQQNQASLGLFRVVFIAEIYSNLLGLSAEPASLRRYRGPLI